MIVGDSISAGPGCYKKYLVQNLTANGITNYDFVGEYPDDCGGGVMHSAVSCTTSASFTQPTFTVSNCFADTPFPGMATLVETHNPDLIMIQLGVNDVWGGNAPIQPILANYTTLVNQARAHNPNVVVMVAQIHKIITDNCVNAASTTNAEQLVMGVPGWAAGVSTAESPVLVADLWTNSDAHEADDCVHPNEAGAQRMGQNWYTALAGILQ
jgi:GDSL-like Lipase/Acylhydrolase family